MRRYAEAGEIGAALRQYEKCREVLRRELGAAPSPETEALHRMIRRSRAVASSRRKSSPARRARNTSRSDVPPAKPSIAVLPFVNLSGDPAQQ